MKSPLIQIGSVASINISPGGVPKHAVSEVMISASGLQGDRHQDSRYHGGPDRAVVMYSAELIEALQREGHPISFGSTGENLTVSGLEWGLIGPGAELTAGETRLVVTKFATPCYKIGASFLRREITRISQNHFKGWSRVCARVLEQGSVRTGDAIQLCKL